MKDDKRFEHQRIVQLTPVSGVYYRVMANWSEGGPLWWKERVEAFALVDHWRDYSYGETASDPAEGVDVDRRIQTVEFIDGYFDVHDDDSEQLIGYYWDDELRDESTLHRIDALAKKSRETEKAQKLLRLTKTPVVTT